MVTATSVRALASVLGTLNQVKALEMQVDVHFGQHPDAETILSQPGSGVVLGAPVLAEFGHDHADYASAKARKSAALRQPANKLVGILHGCLKTGTTYNETAASLHHFSDAAA